MPTVQRFKFHKSYCHMITIHNVNYDQCQSGRVLMPLLADDEVTVKLDYDLIPLWETSYGLGNFVLQYSLIVFRTKFGILCVATCVEIN